MNILLRKIQVVLTPKTKFLQTKLANRAIVYGKNIQVFGGRGI
ncbi:MAG: hypothetical protein ACKPI9_03260 [Dolichospermum sp.]